MAPPCAGLTGKREYMRGPEALNANTASLRAPASVLPNQSPVVDHIRGPRTTSIHRSPQAPRRELPLRDRCASNLPTMAAPTPSHVSLVPGTPFPDLVLSKVRDGPVWEQVPSPY